MTKAVSRTLPTGARFTEIRLAGATIATLVLGACAFHPDRQWAFRDGISPPSRLVFDSPKVRAWILEEETRPRSMGSSDIRQRDVVQKYVEGRLLQYARFTVTCERCGRTYQVDLPEQQRYDLRCDCGHVGTIYIQNLNTLVIRTIKNASEADLFASRLLMPRERFLKAAGRHKAGLASILALTEHFGTSVTSTAIRYVDCDILPCAVLKWGADGLTWKSLSAEAFRASFRKTIEAVDKLPDDCATRRALRGDPVPQAGFFEQGTTVSAWFPFVKSGDGRNAILIEQAVALGRFGVLTFIFPADGKFS